MNEEMFFVVDDHGRVQSVAHDDVANHKYVYETPVEALKAKRDALVTDIAYNGRDIENALKQVNALRVKQANDAVVLNRIMVQLGEVRRHD